MVYYARTAMTLCDKAYNHLSRMLARGVLKPDQKLSERSVSLACGVSRIPVREAIRRLVEEGVLYQKSQSGTYVARLDRQQIVDAYEVREAIETYQLRKAMPRLTDAQKRRLSESCDAQLAIIRKFRASGKPVLSGKPEQDFLAHDFFFHLQLLKAAGNRLAEKIVTTAYRRNRFFGLHSHRRDLTHLAWTWRYHRRMADAIIADDADVAVFWMRQHILRSKKDALKQFDGQSEKRLIK